VVRLVGNEYTLLVDGINGVAFAAADTALVPAASLAATA
jgi:hypothetical protein